MSEFEEFENPDSMKPQLEDDNFTDVMEGTDDGTGNGLGTKVIVFNDNYHTFEQVIDQIRKAINCSEEVGYYHAYTIHNKGQSDVYKGNIEKCLTVSSILQEIHLKTQIVG